jgi:sulfoacetaldehyde dehydrogenase
MSQAMAIDQAVETPGEAAIVQDLIERARRAMAAFAEADQARVDQAVTALAWSLYKPEHARELVETAVRDTGLGNVADKIAKNQRKTFGALRDLLRAKTVGVIEEDPARGQHKVRPQPARRQQRRAGRPRGRPVRRLRPPPGDTGRGAADIGPGGGLRPSLGGFERMRDG